MRTGVLASAALSVPLRNNKIFDGPAIATRRCPGQEWRLRCHSRGWSKVLRNGASQRFSFTAVWSGVYRRSQLCIEGL